MHALVTGGGGFLGRYVVEALLARGDRVRSFGRGECPQLSAQGVDVVRGDIRDSAALARACNGIDCVFHCAAVAGIGMDRDAFDGINRTGTELLLANARHAGVRRFVYTSSPSVAFTGVDQNGVDESAPYGFGWMEKNRAYYSYTKAWAEQAVLSANGGAMRTCALRPHLIWGPGDTHLVPRLITRARAGRLRRVGGGSNLVDVTYVENAAEAHVLAADALGRDVAAAGDLRSDGVRGQETHAQLGDPCTTVGGKAYFISQGQAVNCWEWIDSILSLVGLPAIKKTMSRQAARRIGAVCETLYRMVGSSAEPPMTRFLADQLSTSHWFDISAARRDFGYEPRVSTSEGMERLGDWLRNAR